MPGKLVRIVFKGEENHIKDPQNLVHLLVSARKHFCIFNLKAFIPQCRPLALGLWLKNKRRLFSPWAGMFAHRS